MTVTHGSRRICVAVTVAGILAGCATTPPDVPTPPQLRVRGLTAPPEGTRDVVPARVDIRNGAGDTLYSGDAGNISEYLPLRKLDGPLVVTTTWTNGTSTTQTLSSPPGKPVEIVYDRLQQLPQQRYVLVAVAEPPAGAPVGGGPKIVTDEAGDYAIWDDYIRGVELRGGYGKLSDKPPTFGVTLGSDTALLEAAKKIDYYSVEVDVPIKGKFEDWLAQFELKTNWGSESTGLESAAGSRGQAFQGGFHGGTGGLASNAPSSSHVESKYNEQSVTFAAQAPWGVFNQSEYSRISKELQLSLDRIARKYDSTLEYPAIPGLAANDDQKITTWNFGAGVGASGTHWFDNGVWSSLGGRINVNYLWGDYSGKHHYTNPQAAPTNQDFTQTTGDSKNGITWSGNVFGALGYKPNRNTEWRLRVDYDYLGNGLALQNKVTPSDPDPYLVNGSLKSWRATLGFRYSR